jgi:ABC-type Mn2+/Zn2+ transport system permease subunit
MMVVAVMVGATCNSAGLFLAYVLGERFDLNVPTGPLIILLAAALYALSATANRLRA